MILFPGDPGPEGGTQMTADGHGPFTPALRLKYSEVWRLIYCRCIMLVK
jgi:hypothetical protein